jgi:dATP pyrophosphohydrolase
VEELGTTGYFIALSMTARISKVSFSAHASWSEDLYVIPEHMYAVELASQDVVLSHEHTEYRWLTYQGAFDLLHWQSNQSALWELSQRLQLCDLLEATDRSS